MVYYIERFLYSLEIHKEEVNDLDQNYAECIPILKALADETRLDIVRMLKDGELCACKIQDQFSFSQPTLSYHMKILAQCELVNCRKDGLWMRYSLNHDKFSEVSSLLSQIGQKTNLPDPIKEK